MALSNILKNKIAAKNAKVGVIGLGYVGLPLAVEFAHKRFRVTGFELNLKRVEQINSGQSYILDVPTEQLNAVVKSKHLKATIDFKVIEKLDVIIICVPTPLRKTKEPDISYIISAAEQVAKYLKKGQLVVLESTTYPGTTNEVILPMLEKGNKKAGKDFFLAFSPERVDPANKEFLTGNIPKVVGGVTKVCTQMAVALYGKIVDKVVPVSSSRVAEMVKLLENTFRSVNIGMANEMALLCDAMDIDVWEVIDAAATKPFGFMAFYPGPGIGGECIPADPMYLSWKAKMHGFEARLIDLAAQINSYMPEYVVYKIMDGLNVKKKAVKGSKILILGVAYKKDVSDIRETPARGVISELLKRGATISYYDSYVNNIEIDSIRFKSVKINKKILTDSDVVVLLTDHSDLNLKLIAEHSKLIIDTRNAFKKIALKTSLKNVVTL